MPQLTGFSSVTVNVADLIATVATNRAKHRAVFERAVEVFRERAIAECNALADRIGRNDIPRHLSLSLPVPEVHTDDYDRILRMLKMHTEPTIELTEEAAMHLVDDQWGWSKSFASNTSSYLVQ
jgi:hypothetical protein